MHVHVVLRDLGTCAKTVRGGHANRVGGIVRVSMRACAVAVVLALAASGCRVRVPDARECSAGDAGRPICGLLNPEDVIPLPGTRWVLASQFRRPGNPPGAIVAFTLDGERVTPVAGPGVVVERLIDPILASNAAICPGPLPADGLSPHGMDLVVEAGRSPMLLVVNHGAREAIEVYDVATDVSPPRLRWAACMPLPDGYAGNDVAATENGELVVSAVKTSGIGFWLSLVRMTLALPVGDVLAWSVTPGWTHVPHTQAEMPNGVAMDGDGRRLFVADWGAGRLVRVDRETGRRDEVALPHHPDNLTWTPDGRLLVAGQVGSIRVAFGCLDGAVRNCGQAWSVLAIDPDTLAVSEVASGDGRDFGAASSAALAGDTLVVGTWAGDRVLRLPAR